MPEDAAPEEIQDTPEPEAPEAPEQGTPSESVEDSQPTVDYEKRYNDLRSDYDRRNGRFNELEEFFGNLTNPETQAEALQRLGLELDGQDEPDQDSYVDPDERLDRLEQLLAEREEQAELAELQQLEGQFLDESIEALDDKDLSKGEVKLLKDLALVIRDEQGLPDIGAAYAQLKEASEARSTRYLASKKAPRVELGTAGEEKIDMADDDARVKQTAAVIEAVRQQES